MMKPIRIITGCSESDETLPREHPCHHKNIALQATHAGRVQTDTPIYGILTQPYTKGEEKPDENGNFAYLNTSQDALKGSFVKMSHVKFLEQSGARVVPISYKLD